MWEYKATSQEKQIQYQSINQGFRMVGSRNDKYDLPVKAFKTGDRVTLDYMNSYADEEKNRVNINKRFRPTQYTLEEDDIKSALETYDRQYYNFTIDDIVKLTDIPIEKNKRNYRKQDQHLKLARGQLELLKEMGEVEVGRPSKESLVKEYLEENPDYSPTEIARNLGISRTTVYKYL